MHYITESIIASFECTSIKTCELAKCNINVLLLLCDLQPDAPVFETGLTGLVQSDLEKVSSYLPATMAKRFGSPVSDDKESSIGVSAVPTTTKASTKWGICVLNEWASIRGSSSSTDHAAVNTLLLEMPVADLSCWMGKFVLEVQKKNGKEYQPKSLYTLTCFFKRFFEQNKVHNINPLLTTDNVYVKCATTT